jgi:hypothetical protein
MTHRSYQLLVSSLHTLQHMHHWNPQNSLRWWRAEGMGPQDLGSSIGKERTPHRVRLYCASCYHPALSGLVFGTRDCTSIKVTCCSPMSHDSLCVELPGAKAWRRSLTTLMPAKHCLHPWHLHGQRHEWCCYYNDNLKLLSLCFSLLHLSGLFTLGYFQIDLKTVSSSSPGQSHLATAWL